jgi:hypothetical protein
MRRSNFSKVLASKILGCSTAAVLTMEVQAMSSTLNDFSPFAQSAHQASDDHGRMKPAEFAALVTVESLDEVQARALCNQYDIPVFWPAPTQAHVSRCRVPDA